MKRLKNSVIHPFVQKDLFDASEAEVLRPYVGCAGWGIPSSVKHYFPHKGTHLERYAQVLPAVEINSSFYRPHREGTYARWHDSAPEKFRFSVKVPRAMTHIRRLQNCGDEMKVFLNGVENLREKLGCLLVQLPPSLQYSPVNAGIFFEMLRDLTEVDIVCEPRHPTWFTLEAAGLLDELRIAYVKADPQIVMNVDSGKYNQVMYVRLHGSPVIYHSSYSTDYLHSLSQRLVREFKAGRRVWCIFDNTASGAALENALWTLNAIAKVS